MTEFGTTGEHVSRAITPPENFRGDQPGYYPDRIVNRNTSRMQAFTGILTAATQEIDVSLRQTVQRRLFDLVVHNAYGNVFPPVNSAGDGIGIPDDQEHGEGDQYKNCVVLVKRKKDKCLATAGGFLEMGERPGQAIVREVKEETGATLTSPAIIAEFSPPERDSRFTVVSTVAGGIINPEELQANDDVEQVIVVPLIDSEGNLIRTFLEARKEHTDVRGEPFTHNGVFAEHDKTLEALYQYWQTYGKPKGLSLSQTIKTMSAFYPQEWFEGNTVQPQETENIAFARDKVTEIFSGAGISDAEQKAEAFVGQAIEQGILPKYPQPAVTTDVLALTEEGDSIWAIWTPDGTPEGTLRLPGGFYSPEHEDAGRNLEQLAGEVIEKKLGTGFQSDVYLGTVGGDEADPRYPRVSHIYMGSLHGEPVINEELYPGGKLVKVPILGSDGGLSPEITGGKWEFGHNTQIIQPLIRNALALRKMRES